MAQTVATQIRTLVRRQRYRLSIHAERERDADQILASELQEALSSARLELLEDYPDDPRGHSHLMLGFTTSGAPLHAVCAIHESTVVVITLYRPDADLWQDWRVRKGKR